MAREQRTGWRTGWTLQISSFSMAPGTSPQRVAMAAANMTKPIFPARISSTLMRHCRHRIRLAAHASKPRKVRQHHAPHGHRRWLERIVVYDQLGLFSAARVWWMFRVFGHQDVVLLDGGLPKWIAEDRTVSDEATTPRDRHFTARRHAGMLIDADSVQRGLDQGSLQVVDARPADRFAGSAPEPRPGVRPGHAPGATNVPFPTLLNEDGTLKGVEELRALFADAGVVLDQPVATMCGSGVTAALAALALEMIGHKKVRLYDGSWADWGSDQSRPVVTGPA
jgi:3-mercaptopyruvate sulfurtransferase SseA